MRVRMHGPNMDRKTVVFLCLIAVLAYCTTGVDSKPGTICSLPKTVGPCKARLRRWYYSSRINRCTPFVYGGCKGNRNNFKTQMQCMKICYKKSVCSLPKKVGPCKARFPRWYYNSRLNRCILFVYGGCKGNQNNFKTRLQCMKRCQKKSNCSHPKKAGPCRGSFPRWFYDKTTNKCKKFSWGGCWPNGNNFQSYSYCMKRCYKKPVSVCHLPKKVGPCKARIPRWYYDKTANQCKIFFWGGCQPNGNNFRSPLYCKKKCYKKPVSVCHLSKKVGPCKARIPRWYYDKTANQCKIFFWGGCQPNGNNFRSPLYCKKKCYKKPVSVCHLSKKVGPCKARIPRWYYDKTANQCKIFFWGGCQPNGNNFRSPLYCKKKCYKKPVSVCHLSKKVGPCKARILRWYYNNVTKTCKIFYWGGCLANGNNFTSYLQCTKKCKKLGW